MRIAETLLADPAGAYRQQHLSLMHGWLPLTVQAVTVAAAVGGDRLAQPALAAGVAAHRGGPRRGAVGRGVLVHLLGGAGGRPGSEVAVDLDRRRGHLRGRPGGRLARCPVVAAQRGGGRVSAVHPVCRAGPEPVGGLLPHRPDRVEPADRRAAARSDRPDHRGGDAAGAPDSGQGTVVPGDDQPGRVGIQAPRRARVPAAGLVRVESAARPADADDDRR